jgi:TRAP-type C4-dicarboxylate transport system permease small subunit
LVLRDLEKIGLGATRALSALGLAALMALAAMTLADGLLRWLANRPIEGVRDVGAVFIAVAVSCCLPVGLMERGHISIRVADELFGARAGRALDALAALVVWVVTAAMAWQFTVFAGKIARVGETTWVLKIPTAPFWYVVAVILWVAVAVQAIVVLIDFEKIKK